MAILTFELNYEKIDLNKLQEAFLKYKDSVNINSIKLNELIEENQLDIYNNIKSWRSNVLEGNTTKLKNLKKIIDDNMSDTKGSKIKLISSQNDEEKEIVNLCNAYNTKVEFTIPEIQRVNYILGDSIEYNNFNDVRGSFKREENIIHHNDDETRTTYYVNFSSVADVKNELNSLVSFVNNNIDNCNSFSELFVLSLIFNLEFNRIHPFTDGNGRTSRLFMEKIMEDKGFVPLIFSREESKSIYKKSLLYSDILEDKYNYEEMINKMMFIYEDEIENLKDQLAKYN